VGGEFCNAKQLNRALPNRKIKQSQIVKIMKYKFLKIMQYKFVKIMQ